MPAFAAKAARGVGAPFARRNVEEATNFTLGLTDWVVVTACASVVESGGLARDAWLRSLLPPPEFDLPAQRRAFDGYYTAALPGAF